MDISAPQEMPEIPALKAMLMPWKPAVLRPLSTKIKGGWPRPPLNYSILISLALCNSTSGSLTVQQIYQFARYLLFSLLLVQNEGERDNEGMQVCGHLLGGGDAAARAKTFRS